MLEESLAMGLADIAPDLEMTHGPYQTVLEMLGSRLAGSQLSEDGLQETNYNLQNNDSIDGNEGYDVV